MRATRCFLLAICLSTPLVTVATGCTRTKPAPGGLMLSIETDLAAPKDVGALGVYVSSGGQVIFAHEELVAPGGPVRFPATLAVAGVKTPGATVKARVVAFKVASDSQAVTARIVREAIVTLPTDRQALLRLPLQWLSDGSATGSLPASRLGMQAASAGVSLSDFDPFSDILSTCPPGETSIAGTCVDAAVDATTLPTYAPELVYGAEGGTASSCFDVTSCFDGAVPVTPSLEGTSCTVTLPESLRASRVNVGFRLPATGPGECLGDTCLVPLDEDATYGFRARSESVLELPTAACTRVATAAAELVVSGTCLPKTPRNPPCGPALAGQTGSGTTPGGLPSSFKGDIVDSVEAGPVDIKLDANDVYFVAAGGRVKRVGKVADANGRFAGAVEYVFDPKDPVVGYRLAVAPEPAGGVPHFALSVLGKGSVRLVPLGKPQEAKDVAAQSSLGGIGALGGRAYWAAGNQLRSCDIALGCVSPDVHVTSVAADALAADPATGEVVMATKNKTIVVWSSKTNGLVVSAPVPDVPGAVVSSGDSVYFTVPPADETGRGAVHRVRKVNGATSEVLAADERIGVPLAEAKVPHGIATDGTYVYWTTADSVRAVPVAGGAAVDLATGLPSPRGVAVDDTHVYFTCLSPGQPHGYVLRRPKP